jgi:hypothetical protein
MRRDPLRVPSALVDCSSHLESRERQIPSSKHQIPTHYQPPTPKFHRDSALGLGSALDLGIWSLGFDTLQTTDTVQ